MFYLEQLIGRERCAILEERFDLLTQAKALRRLYERLCAKVCQKRGVSQIALDVLAFLDNHPTLNTAKDVAELRMLPKSNVSQAVEELCCAGLLEAKADKEDRRKVRLCPTSAARPIIEDVRRARKAFETTLFSDFTPEEREQFDEMTRRILANGRLGLKKGSDDGTQQ